MQLGEHNSETAGSPLLIAGHFQEKPGYRIRRPLGRDDWLIVLTCSGRGRFRGVAGEVLTEAKDAILIAPGQPQDYGVAPASAAWELLWAHFQPRPHWREWLDWPEAAPGIRRLSLAGRSEGARVAKCLERTAELASAEPSQSRLFAMAALEEALLWCRAVNPLSAEALKDPRVREAMEYLRQHLSQPIGLADVAAHCGLSTSRLGHLFAAEAGATPQRFLEEQRMDVARQLLDTTNRSVHAIAASVGYENPFYFSLRFKRYVGLSPSQYRRRQIVP